MQRRIQLYAFLLAVIVTATFAGAQEVERPTGGVVDFLAPILPDPVLQHSKETYVLYGCAYCHGVDLKVRNGEAADLMHSGLVGADDHGNLIGGILRHGIPQTAKLSPMPQFSDLSDQEISDIARWIHYARQQGRYAELMAAKAGPTGNAAVGKTYFATNCSTCHAPADLVRIVTKYDVPTLKAQVLRPALLEIVPSFKLDALHDTKQIVGRQRHGALLENYTAQDVASLMAYLQSAK
ncbi:MAG: c-type cytochrome [Granulicella sp.]